MATIPVASFSVGNLHKKMRLRHVSGESDSSTPPGSPTATSFMEPSLWHNTHPLSNHQHNTQTVNSTNNYENSPSLIRSFARAMTPPVSPAPDQQPPAPGQQQPKKISGFLGFYLNNKQLTKPETSSTQSQNDRIISLEPSISENTPSGKIVKS